MGENQNKHGKISLFFTRNSRIIWITSGLSDTQLSGDEISIVLTRQLISHERRKMMEKSDSILSNELGSMVEYRMDGMISGERKILRLSESTHGGIQ
jgi:hypothetical protein